MAHSEDAGGGQSAALRKLLMLSRLLTQQEDQARILQQVSEAAESLVACRTEGILLDQVWQDIGRQGGQISAADVQCSALPAHGARVGCARYGRTRTSTGNGVWAWAYPIPAASGGAGCLI